MKIKFAIVLIIMLSTASKLLAAAYPIPSENESLVGRKFYHLTKAGDNVNKIALRYDLGHNSIENANPHINTRATFPAGVAIQIATRHLLPTVRHGIVINLPEMRMYYFPKGSREVFTYPIGIGKVGKTIPILRTSVIRKVKDPIWIPPDDIREYNLSQGIVLPKVMPAGPENPLGQFAIYMSLPSYLIHSTPFPESIGKRASFGCIRMYKQDIEDFFPTIKRGVPVVIINSPTKIGWQHDHLYLELHQPLEEHDEAFDASLPGMVHMISEASQKNKTFKALVDWQLLSYIAEERDGIPHQIGVRIK